MAITVKIGKKKDNKHANFVRKLVIVQGNNFKRGDSVKFWDCVIQNNVQNLYLSDEWTKALKDTLAGERDESENDCKSPVDWWDRSPSEDSKCL